MKPATMLSSTQLDGLLHDLLAAGVEIIGPARGRDGRIDYQSLTSPEALVLDGGVPRRSLKSTFLPATEPLFAWRLKRGDVEIESVPTSFAPRVVIGARPCDAAGVEVLDRVMGWDYRDELWFGRRAATTVLIVACDGGDRSCFCTSVGLGPDATRGADVRLVPVPGGFRVDILSEKGEQFAAMHADRFATAGEIPEAEAFLSQARSRHVAPWGGSPAAVERWLGEHFEHELWGEVALRCHGCGACAAVCPTCHCFDIVDEPDGVMHGTRRRNADTCQTARFTVHASGHNPRADQAARLRQRVRHKFQIYPSRFGQVLCTGCGRCSRACPGGVDLPEILTRLEALAGPTAGDTPLTSVAGGVA